MHTEDSEYYILMMPGTNYVRNHHVHLGIVFHCVQMIIACQ